MYQAQPSDNEHTSDLVLWSVLFCSALALVVFFSWILKGQSALFFPDTEKDLIVQPLSEARPETTGALESLNNAVSKIERVHSLAASSAILNNTLSLAASNGQADRQGSANFESVKESALQPARSSDDLAPAVALESGQSTTGQTGQLRQSAVQKNAERIKHQQREAEHTALSVDRDAGRDLAERADVEPMQGSPVRSKPQASSADLSDLRQLLAEAAAINAEEDEEVRAVREQREAMGSLGELSSALRFAPGSKVVSETMVPALDQIERILAKYPETRISVIVATNESGDNKRDMLLSQERGRALIARLVNEGMDFTRFSLKALRDEQLPANSQRVEILAHSES